MWSEPKAFVVSVSVKHNGCDGYPDEDSDESCEYFLAGISPFYYFSHVGKNEPFITFHI